MDSITKDSSARGATGRPEPADALLSDRPGVPMNHPTGAVLPAKRPALERQVATTSVLVGVDVGQLTPVFGTAQPPRGLSGLVRRAAYRIPEHKAARWMLLMLGDRVDVWESRVARQPLVTAALALGAIGVWQLRQRRRQAGARRLISRFA
jgi:hypothetical protein